VHVAAAAADVVDVAEVAAPPAGYTAATEAVVFHDYGLLLQLHIQLQLRQPQQLLLPLPRQPVYLPLVFLAGHLE
jgi:hypothetical protein